MIFLSHPTANQNVRQAAIAFAQSGLLEEFWTCLNWKEGGLLDRLAGVSARFQSQLRRRSFPAELAPFIRTFPWRELGRQAVGPIGWEQMTRDERDPLSIEAVYRSFDRRVAEQVAASLRIRGIYAYEDGARDTFRAAKERGIKCIFEHPSIYWRVVREIQREEAELHPEWAPTLRALGDSEEKLARKDQELALADLVITPSSFARKALTLAPVLTAPVHAVLYGADPAVVRVNRPQTNRTMRVLFVGALSQAKGLGYLLEAVTHLEGDIELTLIGRRVSSVVPTSSTLDKFRWIPSLPHHELLQEMSQHDVLVLPSLHEGFGLVMTEAMGQGLVVITTPHTAGPDLITNGVDGFVVPVRSAEMIEERIALLLRDRDRLRAMQGKAREKALASGWEIYRQRLVQLAREVVERGT